MVQMFIYLLNSRRTKKKLHVMLQSLLPRYSL